MAKAAPKKKPTGKPFAKNHSKVGGRAKGTPNKFTGTLKQMILEALDRRGGVDWLVKLNKDHFVQLLLKVLPHELSVPPAPSGAPGRLLTPTIVNMALALDQAITDAQSAGVDPDRPGAFGTPSVPVGTSTPPDPGPPDAPPGGLPPTADR